MKIDLATPALLFPAISLLMLAYTNRFVVLANLIRQLHSEHGVNPPETVRCQIENLRRRVVMIRNMQALGVLAMLGCTIAMLALFAGWNVGGEIFFAISVLLLAGSLWISFREIQISVVALKLALNEMQGAASPDGDTGQTR